MKNIHKTLVMMMICFFITHSAFADLSADFIADQTIVMAGNPIQFTDLSTGNPTSWEWDFENDGTIDSYEQNPEWIYNEIGIYSISLTISDGTNEDTELKENYITVIEAQAPILLYILPEWPPGSLILHWEEIPYYKTNHFNFEGGDPSNPVWTIYIGEAKILGEDMEAGDKIGIYDGELLVGAFTLNQVCTPENQFKNDMIAFNVLVNGPGYSEGNAFILVAWDESEQIETIGCEYIFSDPYGDAWTGDVFPNGDAPYSIAELAFNSGSYIPVFNIYKEDGTLVRAGTPGNTYEDFVPLIGTYCYYITQIMDCGIESNPSNIECIYCPPQERTIFGIISNETSPIEGALVILEGTSYSAISNSDGLYYITDIEPGTYDITASADGYSSETIYDQIIEEYNFWSIDFTLIRIQTFNLFAGYQFISSQLSPDNPDMLFVMADVLNENLDYARNSYGQSLIKIGPNWVNGIGDWIVDEGYLIKMFADDSFSINGVLADPSTQIPLETGFQFVSYLPDVAYNAMDAFFTIIGDDLDFVRNSQGQTLRKIGPNWVNGIGDWIIVEGYLIKMFNEDSFSIEGIIVDPTSPIQVETGYRFVSYFPNAPMDAILAFQTIIGDDLDFIRNSQGQTLRKIGPNWVNGIGDCNPGEGYLLKMFGNGEVIYPVAAKSSGKITAFPTHFIFKSGNPAEAVYTLYIKGLKIGDEVAAFDGDKMVGSVKINSQNAFENELPVFSTLINGQGYEVSNPIILKVWSENNLVSVDFTMEAVYDSYVSDVYPEGDGKYSVVNIIKGVFTESDELIVYPNPANEIINIVSSNEIKSVSIINNVGQTFYRGNETQININNLESGVYIIMIDNGNEVISKKILIK
jgi:PKD repeat protein